MNLKTLLKRPAVTIEEGAPATAARELMRRQGVRHLPVLRNSELVGMVTELDLLAAGPSSVPELRVYDWDDALAGLSVSDVMSRRPVALTPDTSVADAARLARQERIEAFPVLDGGDIVGVVTRGDLLAVLHGLLDHWDPTGLGHVLVATSLRAGQAGALDSALPLAAAAGAAVTALHVRPARRWMAGPEGAMAEPVGWVERIRCQIADKASAVQSRAGRVPQLTFEVAEGSVVREIARRAMELDSDLIVVGKAHRRGLIRRVAKTVAGELVKVATCPVLAVPRESEGADAGR
jgi:CBS domain-containing protein/nucleotide-binding universal stress UspA family protein